MNGCTCVYIMMKSTCISFSAVVQKFINAVMKVSTKYPRSFCTIKYLSKPFIDIVRFTMQSFFSQLFCKESLNHRGLIIINI